MSKATLDLKDPGVAALLAWLIPGLGHFYQGRMFKAVLYFVCILSTFAYGMYLGDGKVVHWKWDAERKTYGYLAQVLVGLPALPALIQAYRLPPSAHGTDRSGNQLDHKLTGEFAGKFKTQFGDGRDVLLTVTGTIDLEPGQKNDFRGVSGTFRGEVHNPQGNLQEIPDHVRLELTLNSLDRIEPAIFPSRDRKIDCQVQGVLGDGDKTEVRGNLYGQVLNVRSLVDSFEAPLDDVGLQDANGDLGKYFELGLVYTWIAGLLNILVIWDAFEGPAYGYGNEDELALTGAADASAADTASASVPGKPVPPSTNGEPSRSRGSPVKGRAPPVEAPVAGRSAVAPSRATAPPDGKNMT